MTELDYVHLFQVRTYLQITTKLWWQTLLITALFIFKHTVCEWQTISSVNNNNMHVASTRKRTYVRTGNANIFLTDRILSERWCRVAQKSKPLPNDQKIVL